MMLLLNLGSRYIVHEMADTDEEYRKYILIRRLAVFAVCFVGTRNVIVSLILTAAFIVFSTGLYHNKSVYAREGMTNQDLVNRAVAVEAATLSS
jgi:hypothetical protein